MTDKIYKIVTKKLQTDKGLGFGFELYGVGTFRLVQNQYSEAVDDLSNEAWLEVNHLLKEALEE